MPDISNLTAEELRALLKEKEESDKKIKGPLINELNTKFNECLDLFHKIKSLNPKYFAPWENQFRSLMLYYLIKEDLAHNNQTIKSSVIVEKYERIYTPETVKRLLENRAKGGFWSYDKATDMITLAPALTSNRLPPARRQ